MNNIKQKFKSNTGASMLIAIVFLLFCVFVGGSILAVASANFGRVRANAANDQAYLSQRSAALLIAGDLQRTNPGASVVPLAITHDKKGNLTFNDNSVLEDFPSSLQQLACFCAAHIFDAEAAQQLTWEAFPALKGAKLLNYGTVEGTSYSVPFTIRLDVDSSMQARGIAEEEIQCTMTCDCYYNITITVAGDSNICVYVPLNEDASDFTKANTVKLSWDYPEIRKVGQVG